MYKLSIFILFAMTANINGYYRSNSSIKLTTAKRLPTMMPKPTYSTIKEQDSEIVVEEGLVSSLYALKGSGRRMGPSEIWSWEHWCELQPKKGNCLDPIERFYYDAQIDQCMKFTYSGCGGNNNSFESIQKCERFCSGAPYESLKDDVTYMCEIQPDVGICLELKTKFYYDVNDRECKEFQYGGCGGNRNRFDTMEACLTECGKSSNDK